MKMRMPTWLQSYWKPQTWVIRDLNRDQPMKKMSVLGIMMRAWMEQMETIVRRVTRMQTPMQLIQNQRMILYARSTTATSTEYRYAGLARVAS